MTHENIILATFAVTLCEILSTPIDDGVEHLFSNTTYKNWMIVVFMLLKWYAIFFTINEMIVVSK